MERAQKTDQKHRSIIAIVGIPLEIWHSKFFEKCCISKGIPAMFTIFIFFWPIFYGLSDGGINFSIQRISFFSIFSFLVKPLEQKKAIAFYEILEIKSSLPKVSIHVPNRLRQ